MVSLYYLLLAIITFGFCFLTVSENAPSSIPKAAVTPVSLAVGAILGLGWPIILPIAFLFGIRNLTRGAKR